MLKPEQIEGLQIAFERLITPITEFLLQDIARRVQEAGQLTSTAEYQLYRIQMINKGIPGVQKKIEQLVKIAQTDAQELVETIAEICYNGDVERLEGEVDFSDNKEIQQILEAAQKLAKDDLSNITQTLGFINQDGVTRELTSAYISATDFAFDKVISGAEDYNTAIRKACRQLANKGIQSINYASGVKTSLEAAVRRNLMGGAGLMVEQISEQNFKDLGADGWEISAHANSAPDHEDIQGKIYTDAEYRALNSRLKRRIGTLNCGHTASPIIIGVSQPQYTKKQLQKFKTENHRPISYEGKPFESVYEASQYQRQIERAIRAQKRRVMLATEKDAPIAKSKLNVLRQEYRRFSKAVGLRTEDERLFVAGFGRARK